MPFQFPLLPFISVHISIRLHCIPMLKSFIQNHRARIYRLNKNIGNIFGSYAYFRFRNMSCWETTVIYIENGLFLWAYFQTPSNRRHWGVWITTDWFLVFLNWWCFFFRKMCLIVDKLLRLSEIPIFYTNFKERYLIIQLMAVFRENGDLESCMSSSWEAVGSRPHQHPRHSTGLDG